MGKKLKAFIKNLEAIAYGGDSSFPDEKSYKDRFREVMYYVQQVKEKYYE